MPVYRSGTMTLRRLAVRNLSMAVAVATRINLTVHKSVKEHALLMVCEIV